MKGQVGSVMLQVVVGACVSWQADAGHSEKVASIGAVGGLGGVEYGVSAGMTVMGGSQEHVL